MAITIEDLIIVAKLNGFEVVSGAMEDLLSSWFYCRCMDVGISPTAATLLLYPYDGLEEIVITYLDGMPCIPEIACDEADTSQLIARYEFLQAIPIKIIE